MKNAATRELFAYWNALRGARPAPRRVEIDPTAIPRVLPDVALFELHEGGSIVVRLAGTRLCDLFARELRGRAAAALWAPRSRDEIDHLLRDVMADAGVAVVAANGQRDGRPAVPIEMMALPLTDDSGRRRFVIATLAAVGQAGFETVEALEATNARLSWPTGARGEETLAGFEATVGLLGPDARRIGRFVVYDGGRDPPTPRSAT